MRTAIHRIGRSWIRRFPRFRRVVDHLRQAAIANLQRPLATRRFESAPVLLGVNAHGHYAVPRGTVHRPASRAVLLGRVYERDTLDVIRTAYISGDVVHAGAFFGDFLPFLSTVVGSRGVVRAFEPAPENYRAAAMTVLMNDLSNVDLRPAGLGASPSTAEILVADKWGRPLGGASTIRQSGHVGGGGEAFTRTRVVTIDDSVTSDRAVSIIQLDVEGYEESALQGGIETIRRCLPVLVLEDNEGAEHSQWFSTSILALGYRRLGTVDGNKVFGTEAHADSRLVQKLSSSTPSF